MSTKLSKGPEAVARVLVQQPDRVAAAWRRLRFSQGPRGEVKQNLLDNVIEPFVREIGHMLAGEGGKPWTRTQSVLRLSPDRGVRAIFEEFAALRRCLHDTVEVLGGGLRERVGVNEAIDEAVDSAVALCLRMTDPSAPAPKVPFGGLVVEIYEPNAAQAEADAAAGYAAAAQ